MNDMFMSARHLVRPEDLNPANRLFGGRMMEWADEAAALYAMCQLQTKNIVTLKVSEILFKNPAFTGDVVEFYTRKKAVGTTSLTVELLVRAKCVPGNEVGREILSCEFIFVCVGEDGRPKPHGIKE